MTSPSDGLTGIVLAGGRSSRFGQDKSSALFRGVPLLQIVASTLAEVCSELIVVRALGSAGAGIELPVQLQVVGDRREGLGPLEGMRAGLEAASTAMAAVVATDLPLLRASLIHYLAAEMGAHEAVVPFVGGRLQPLVAVYRVEAALAAAVAALDDGERAMAAALDRLDVLQMEEIALEGVDPGLLSFRNANTPGELAELERLVVS